ncbi:MAG TPA: hypothetical protein VHD63_08535 [Ktedonobacteraceae bacterium]|nr:hypothetical protein [Ktedonobacteraceae bacterium]
MDLFPLSHVGAILGIDPKTLRLWLHEAGLTAIPHPDDARQKCLSLTQIQQVADTHGRHLPPAFASSAAPPPSLPPPDVLSQLAQMQLQIFSLQEQVTRLSLALLQLSSTRPSPPLPPPTASASPATVAALPPVSDAPPRPRPPSRAVPMIAFTADGGYQIVDPDKGVLDLTPDSAQWFAWLANTRTLTFQGRHGSFTATRRLLRGKRVQSWNVYRCLHGRSCTLYAGMTMTLTTARMEGLAQQLLTRLAPL